jgi:hypothetical protein
MRSVPALSSPDEVEDYITTHTTGYLYMPILRPTRTLALVAAGLASAPTIGCSKEPDRSVAGFADTSAAAQIPETSAAVPRPHTPVGHPVRKPKSDVTSRASANPAPDTSAQPPAPPSAEASPDKWLSYDAATNTVTFELIAGPFTFNGYRNGEATLVVPPKANVVMNFINKDGTPHSAILISGEGPIPNSASDPAIPRAYTNKVLEGLPQEAGDVMRFPVPETGTYRIFCGVPGHGLSGMWIWMKVDPAVKTPTFGPTKG